MKRLGLLLLFLLLSALSVIQFACVPTTDQPIEDVYFVPVDTVVRQKAKPAPVEMVPVGTAEEDDGARKTLAEMLFDQDKHLDNIIRQLDIVANREPIDTAKYSRYTNTDTAGKVSNELLLEMVRQRNQKLDSVIKRLDAFAKNQRKETQKTDSVVTASMPVQKQSISSIESSSGYGKAIQSYRKRQYTRAIREFQALLREGIDSTLRDNCHFWSGVCDFSLKKTNRAISEFQKVLDIPGSDKKEGAIFMIGQCYEQIGMKNRARTIFRKMIREYPQGDLKQVAEIKIALLR